MPADPADEHLDKVLGVGLGVVAIVSAFLALGFAIWGLPSGDGLSVVLVTTGLLSIAYLVAGVYDTAYAKPRRGVSNLTASAGMVLSFLATFAAAPQQFMAAGFVFMIVAGGALMICGFRLNVLDRLPQA
ncbi:hypothetical protein [Halococcoides cellulosivorans]|uniref:Uncharacterized protein n=1 Tax=Halococcoides cellulosivorans TaxID=1679096 RepID=A0A2R4WXI2_9EURY|nr:hypothetical protein [Halococcoides cellulosivorans]AWB26259.1 hypothetical protein HARCEL1_00255 [Halococcoides cellulosivorans]